MKPDVLKEKILKILEITDKLIIDVCGTEALIEQINTYEYNAKDLDGVSWSLNSDTLETFVDMLITQIISSECEPIFSLK